MAARGPLNREDLESKSLVDLKAIAAATGVNVEGRSKEAYIEAIAGAGKSSSDDAGSRVIRSRRTVATPDIEELLGEIESDSNDGTEAAPRPPRTPRPANNEDETRTDERPPRPDRNNQNNAQIGRAHV